MLTSLRLTDFKSFRDQTVPLAPLTVLVGANASGKSNFFDAVRFLQGVGLNYPISAILLGHREGGRTIWPGLRGGVAEAARFGCDGFALQSVWDLTRDLELNQWAGEPLGIIAEHDMECRISGSARVTRERLSFPDLGTVLFDTENLDLWGNTGMTKGMTWMTNGHGTPGRNQAPGYEAQKSLLGRIALGPPADLHRAVSDRVEILLGKMINSVLVNITPSVMRDYRSISEVLGLGDEGEDISPVLWRFCRQPERKADLIDWLSELCAPRIVDIRFDETRQGEIRFELVEADGAVVSARSLSDGTLRFLGLIATLLTVGQETAAMPLLLIEEIENGLHPTRLHLLVELLEQVTKSGRVQVIATTHSPLVLQHLSHEALGNAVVFGRIPDEPGTVARRLRDLRNFDDVAARRGVDRLFATGWLERAL